MNVNDLHDPATPVSAKPLFRCTNENALTIQILKGQELKEHITKKPALLICVKGSALYSSVAGDEVKLSPGELVNIPVDIKHKVVGLEDSQLILLR